MKIKVPKVTAEKISEEEAAEMMTGFDSLNEVIEKLEKWQEANEKRGFLILGYNEEKISYFGTGGERGTLAGIMASLIMECESFRRLMMPSIIAASKWISENKDKVTIIEGKEDNHAN